ADPWPACAGGRPARLPLKRVRAILTRPNRPTPEETGPVNSVTESRFFRLRRLWLRRDAGPTSMFSSPLAGPHCFCIRAATAGVPEGCSVPEPPPNPRYKIYTGVSQENTDIFFIPPFLRRPRIRSGTI